ncbi:hypothetical protein O181_011069 [Austropuccinia psidii MF-1]|uniref:Reverse transcriptase domain-containing protein n=1 Tax=Austropuccinia psidii MF-1 TaxID=1389203 RepID=A0A9Q3GLH8_9BASI|nr:hypothetical protein [Austropuccinia psidii MF-1]
MDDIITRTRIGKTWIRNPMEFKMIPKISREDKKPFLKCHKCGRTSHLPNTFIKKTKINEFQVIEEVQSAEEKEESYQDSEVSEETQVEDYSIENITAFFEVTEVHTHLTQYSKDCYNLINIQDARMFDITLNIDRPFPPVLRISDYTESPRAREALEKHIQELIPLSVLRKVGHNEEVEATTPVIVSWHNDKSRMVGDFRELNTYTVPDRYPIPIIQETLTPLSKYRDIKSMDELKGFHKNGLTPKSKKLPRVITHCGIYEDLRVPFVIKNSLSHYKRMMNTIFPTELSEGWLIIYIDDIIICSYSWSLHLKRPKKVLAKFGGVNMKFSLKKSNFGFEELKALGHIVSGLSLGIEKKK